MRGTRSSPPTMGTTSSPPRTGSVRHSVEVVRLAVFVDRLRRAAVEEHEGALHGRHLHRGKVPVQYEHRHAEHVGHPPSVKRDLP